MLAVETARRLACDSTLVGIVEDSDGEPLNVGRKTRAISPALRRALKSRDGGCRFPGCDRTQYTEGHHARHWADGGETKLGNLVTLCSFHHRLIHEGGFGLRVTDDGAFVFTRPDGTRIVAGQRLRMRDFERQGADRQHRDRQHRDGQQGGGPGGWQEVEADFTESADTGQGSAHGVAASVHAATKSAGQKCFRGNILDHLHALSASRDIDVRPPPGWTGESMDYGIAVERMLWEQGAAG